MIKKANRGKFKNTTKEERAKALNNVICPYCGYQNHEIFIKKYGKCNLCKRILDKDYFKRTFMSRIGGNYEKS